MGMFGGEGGTGQGGNVQDFQQVFQEAGFNFPIVGGVANGGGGQPTQTNIYNFSAPNAGGNQGNIQRKETGKIRGGGKDKEEGGKGEGEGGRGQGGEDKLYQGTVSTSGGKVNSSESDWESQASNYTSMELKGNPPPLEWDSGDEIGDGEGGTAEERRARQAKKKRDKKARRKMRKNEEKAEVRRKEEEERNEKGIKSKVDR